MSPRSPAVTGAGRRLRVSGLYRAAPQLCIGAFPRFRWVVAQEMLHSLGRWNEVNTHMSQNEALAAAAHLHVLLRRKTGRVTDTEWMASNADYAQAMVRFAREKAASDGHTDLVPLADRLESLMRRTEAPARTPLLDGITARMRAPHTASEADDPAKPASVSREDLSTRYVGRLR